MSTILDIQHISKSFFHNGEHSMMLNDVNFALEKGLVTALIGANGTGKTTLFNIISGLEKPNKNLNSQIVYNDSMDLLHVKPYELVKHGVGRLFQDTHIFPNLSVVENLMLADDDTFGEQPLQVFKSKKLKASEDQKKEKALLILDRIFKTSKPTEDLKVMLAKELSYGQQRLLGLARLLMNDRLKLILLDEPTAGVNEGIISKIIDIIQQMKQEGKTIFLIEHNIGFVKTVSDNVLFLNHGQIALEGTTESVLSNTNLKKDYLGLKN